MKIHFIAIGGSAMHNLAIALYKKGYTITGSDDEVFEPSKSRLQKYNLLPVKTGWDKEMITSDLDAVILGMHARADNPELLRAQELGLKVFSYPEYIYEQSKTKTRIVIGGSHGKTTITSMIMHVLSFHHLEFDYLVGAQIEGFDTMVRLTENAPFIILEGDEYLSSPIDRRPKFHLYHPHIALISGIAWDHINVFPTFESYVEQFRIFMNLLPEQGKLIYCADDQTAKRLAEECVKNIIKTGYTAHTACTENQQTFLLDDKTKIPFQLFGKHNLCNVNGARLICRELGIDDKRFYEAISSFRGASKRLQLLGGNEHTKVFLDFAHAPSKLKATTMAVKEQYPKKKLVACMELHTFSSLKKEFLPHYKDSMVAADIAFVYFNPHTIEHKKLEPVSVRDVADAFGGENLTVFTDSTRLVKELLSFDWQDKNLLMMSSGNFDGIDFKKFSEMIINASV